MAGRPGPDDTHCRTAGDTDENFTLNSVFVKNNKEQKILQKKQEGALMKMLNKKNSVDILQPLLDGLGKFLFFPFQRLSLSFKANSFVSPSPAQSQNKQSTQI